MVRVGHIGFQSQSSDISGLEDQRRVIKVLSKLLGKTDWIVSLACVYSGGQAERHLWVPLTSIIRWPEKVSG